QRQRAGQHGGVVVLGRQAGQQGTQVLRGLRVARGCCLQERQGSLDLRMRRHGIRPSRSGRWACGADSPFRSPCPRLLPAIALPPDQQSAAGKDSGRKAKSGGAARSVKGLKLQDWTTLVFSPAQPVSAPPARNTLTSALTSARGSLRV